MKHKTLKIKIIRRASMVMCLYLLVLMVFLNTIVPRMYSESQKQLNNDILGNINCSFIDLFGTIQNAYMALVTETEFNDSIEVINQYEDVKYGDYTAFNRAKNRLQQKFTELAYNNNNYMSKIGFVSLNQKISINIENIENFLNKGDIFGTQVMFLEDAGSNIFKIPVYDFNGIQRGSILFYLIPGCLESITSPVDVFLLNNSQIVYSKSDYDFKFEEISDLMSKGKRSPEMIKKDGRRFIVLCGSLQYYNYNTVVILPIEKMGKTFTDLILICLMVFLIVMLISMKFISAFSDDISKKITKVINEMELTADEEYRIKEKLNTIKKHTPIERYVSQKFGTLSLKSKIWLYHALFLMLPILINSVLVIVIFNSAVALEVRKNIEIFSEVNTKYLESNFSKAENTLKTVLTDSRLFEGINAAELNREEYAERYFVSLMKNKDIEYDVEIYNAQKAPVYKWIVGFDDGEIKDEKIKSGYEVNERNGKLKFTKLKRVYQGDFDGEKFAGYVRFSVYADSLLNNFYKINGNTAEIYLVDENDKIIYAGNRMETHISFDNMMDRSRHCISRSLINEDFPVKVVYAVDTSAKKGMYLKIAECVMLIWLVISLICLLLAMRLRKYIIEAAQEAQYLLEDEYAEVKPGKRNDELDLLFVEAGKMKTRIKLLINEIYEYQVYERELQLETFKSQIAPHFIYNFLEIINGLVEEGDRRASKLIVLLGTYLRQCVTNQKKILTIREEIEYTKIYVDIQNIALDQKLKVAYAIDRKFMDCKIVNFVLQPIIENTLKHRNRVNKDEIYIYVHAYKAADKLKISIRDWGIGMSKDRLNEVRANILTGTSKKNVGLRNIHNRLRLLFGEQYGMKIYSSEGSGTLVVITVPYSENGME